MARDVARTVQGKRATIIGRVTLTVVCVLCFALGATACTGLSISWWISIPLFAGLLSLIVAGVAMLSSGVFAAPLLSVATRRPELALTFDDGPDGERTRALLDLLELRGHRATFFVIGERAERQPALLAELSARGHQVENHSWSHSYATPFAPPARLAAELEKTSALIAAACGRGPRWFRPPVGLLSPRIAEAARLSRLGLAGWSATARDGVARRTPAEALARLVRGARPGAILVLHDRAPLGASSSVALDVLPRLLDELDARGLRSVTLSALLADGAGG